jgi:hypothetical protein
MVSASDSTFISDSPPHFLAKKTGSVMHTWICKLGGALLCSFPAAKNRTAVGPVIRTAEWAQRRSGVQGMVLMAVPHVISDPL